MEEIKKNMRYVNLGRSGLKVSTVAYGSALSFATDDGGQEKANALVKYAWDSGINFFDTAESYSDGKAEKILGVSLKALNVPRSDYVISTKIFWGKHDQNTTAINNRGTSRKRLQEGLAGSLKRLQLDYVDVVFCHRYDFQTPTIEVVQTMKDIIASGKALYWGTSKWPADRVMEAILLSDIVGCPRPIAEQCEYNMLVRENVEKSLIGVFDDYGYGTTIYSPMKGGLLSGKYNEGIPEGSRYHKFPHLQKLLTKKGGVFSEENKEHTLKAFKGLAVIAEKLGGTQAQLALAWTLKCKDVTTCLLGAKNIEQLSDNLGAILVADKITEEISEEIEGLLENRPELYVDSQTFLPLPNRR